MNHSKKYFTEFNSYLLRIYCSINANQITNFIEEKEATVTNHFP